MFVFRIESQYGIGPYNNGGFEHCKMNLSTHPLPQSDGIPGFVSERHLCGFKSIKQLLEWFDEDALRELSKLNRVIGKQDDTFFHVAVYTVDEKYVVPGNKQLAFEHYHAKRIAQMPIEYGQKILEKQNQ